MIASRFSWLNLCEHRPELMSNPSYSLWETPLELVGLDPDEVHVWRASLDVAPERLQTLSRTLSADERERAERFHFLRDRNRFVAARGLLRILLGRYLQMPPDQLRFGYNSYGKPFLANEDTFVRFNLSHSGVLALYAVTRGHEIGVDVEYVSEDVDTAGLGERFFSTREVAALNSLPAYQKQRAFFACWTRKEAYIKARGEGLSAALDSFSVSLKPAEPPALLNVENDPQEISRWCFQEIHPDPRYAAAVAVEGRNLLFRCLEFERDPEAGEFL
jgi:4'-phosphopantetheinyl transferase